MVRGGLHRAALPAGCVAQEKLGYGVFESNPQNEILFFIYVKGGFFSESAIRFFKSPNLQKKYSKKLS